MEQGDAVEPEVLGLDIGEGGLDLEWSGRISMADVLRELRPLRIGLAGLEEAALRDCVQELLGRAGLLFEKEVSFAPRCRADLWMDGLVIELKKQRPIRAEVLKQLTRYAKTGKVRGIILVLERSIKLPTVIANVPCAVVSLNSLWGMTI